MTGEDIADFTGAEYVTVPADRDGLELDEFLGLLYPEWTKGFLRQEVRAGRVLVDGMTVLPSIRLRADQVVIIKLDQENEPPPRVPVGPAEAVDVLFENENLLVVDKPPGLAVEPERWARDNASLAGAALDLVRNRVKGEAGEGPGVPFRARIVHRIDKDTSGAVLMAKDLETERILRAGFEAGRMEKRYLALVEGELDLADGEELEIDRPLGPDPRKAGRMVVDEAGKRSLTFARVARRFRGYTLVECRPVTGRTHQIRVHLASEGFPLAVDSLYGRRDALFLSKLKPRYKPKPGRKERAMMGRLTLHAASVGWSTPLPGADGQSLAPLTVEAPLPADFVRTLKQIEKVRPQRP